MEGLLIVQRPQISEDEISGTRSKFSVEPLEPGFGYTLGNSLRRTLLSSIPGAAVTQIKIDSVVRCWADRGRHARKHRQCRTVDMTGSDEL